MKEHPIPQNISTYEFRLVGDMTLKQFFQLAGGALVALVFYASSLPAFVKWPFIVFFALFGAALAFLPFEDRSLTTWIIVFVKAVYSPTRYVWAEGGAKTVFKGKVPKTPVLAAPQGEKKAEYYLNSVPQPRVFKTFDEKEKSFLKRVSELFQTVQVSNTPQTVQQQTVASPLPNQGLGYTPVSKAIPKDLQAKKQPVQERQYVQKKVVPVFERQRDQNQSSQASFTQQAAPPMPPGQPNTISGQVLGQDGKIVEGAILEICDSSGIPVRALKTNKLGHFLNVTSLKNGDYTIRTDKEGLVFDDVAFQAKGEIIQPILIRAKP